jgi:predicted DNA-binding transcriptional regulator AlpA
MSELRAVPSLDELAAHPEKAAELSAETVAALYSKVRQTEAALLARLLLERPAVANGNGSDRFLDAAAVGAMIGKSRSWVEKHPEDLPKRRKVGGEGMWSEREVQTWMKHRETWE